jgi:hypothetical protein
MLMNINLPVVWRYRGNLGVSAVNPKPINKDP